MGSCGRLLCGGCVGAQKLKIVRDVEALKLKIKQLYECTMLQRSAVDGGDMRMPTAV